jgi:hypothetical protein
MPGTLFWLAFCAINPSMSSAMRVTSKIGSIFVRAVVASAIFSACCERAAAHHFRYSAKLSGAAEDAPNNSPAVGHVIITIDFDENVLTVDTSFSGLIGTVTDAQIHAMTLTVGTGTAGAATQVPSFDEFPSGVTSGDYEHEFDLALATTYNPAFITSTGSISNAYNALAFAMNDGKAYFNIATTAFPNGEIRGFLSYVPGDFNNNGVVDAADYVLWRGSLGTTGEGLLADSNNDNVISNDDYEFWRANFGKVGVSNVAGGASVLAAEVPEPSLPSLLAVVVAWWSADALHLMRRRRRSCRV